ncbi:MULTISPECIES: hypothetical protein [unclassified Ruegeria]|uniref:hypothetical protein n=1 Tax=unclassified Ruegeria TaxID=2625375 RepID=UPI001487B032|nr:MULTISPECIES: hypothetical protein [unclassified Ruegeria]NOD77903.1 hypothetical protein [Ruegeria sp. HKCCD4332]NOD88134.1 hypothetical protein [Ruegeria sp. HKCCD4318]NOD93820.1 hypothetical protein [Ruegeria sp. HKCCD4884]NOE14982.1 hypothetical protein [Ruegeria sp. HKCCD4318-2]NOG11415.1 hypothetical protein [Ruegeria sp. HKCCD4315]
MRDVLSKSLEVLVWITAGLSIVFFCFTAIAMLRLSPFGPDTATIIAAFLTVVFGITSSLVFAGICFQIMDIRTFTKHSAISLKNRR